MAKNFKTNLIISGDPSGGLKAVRVTDEELKKLDKQVHTNQRSAGELSKAFTHLRTNAGSYALAAGAAAAGVVALTARTAAATRNTKTLADALGTSTGSLQAFEYAAKQAGIETDKAADIVKDLEDHLGDAALTGGGQLAPVLKRIGLNAKELVKESPVQQLIDIGNAIKDLPKAEQVNILESMSDDATRLLPLLQNNAAELRQYSAQARQFGVAMDSVSVQKLIAANQATQELEGVFTGLENTLAVGVAPALTKAAGNAESLASTFENKDFQHGVTVIANSAVDLAEALAKGVAQVGQLASAIDNLDLSKIAKFALSRTGPGYLLEKLGVIGGPDDNKTDDDKPIQMKPITVTGSAPHKAAASTHQAASTLKAASAVNTLNNAYNALNGQLSQQIALFDKTSETAQIRYKIENGDLSKLSDARKQNLLGMAQEIDRLNAQKKAVQALFPAWRKLQQASQLKASVANLPANEQQFGKKRAAQLIQQSATAGLPEMQGLDPEYNGPFGEANRLQGQQASYEKAYQQRLASYRQYAQTHQDDVATANQAIEALDADHQQRTLEYQQQIEKAKRAGYENLYGDLTSIVGGFAGRQSSIYKGMFVAEKAYDIASTLMSQSTAIGKAWESAPFPENLAAVASTIAGTAGLVSDIEGVSLAAGQAHDGSSSLPKDGTYYMQGGERVVDRSANKDLTRYLNRANQTTNDNRRGGDVVFSPNITVEAKPGVTPQQANAQGKQIYNGLRQQFQKFVVDEQRPGGLLYKAS